MTQSPSRFYLGSELMLRREDSVGVGSTAEEAQPGGGCLMVQQVTCLSAAHKNIAPHF